MIIVEIVILVSISLPIALILLGGFKIMWGYLDDKKLMVSGLKDAGIGILLLLEIAILYNAAMFVLLLVRKWF